MTNVNLQPKSGQLDKAIKRLENPVEGVDHITVRPRAERNPFLKYAMWGAVAVGSVVAMVGALKVGANNAASERARNAPAQSGSEAPAKPGTYDIYTDDQGRVHKVLH